METLKRRNQKLINAAFQLHQEGCIMPDSYIIDVDIFLENAEKILNEAKKYGIKLYYMTKQIGRNPYLAKELEKIGYSGVVAVDFKEAELFINNGLKIGNVGHIVQIPKNMIKKVVRSNPEIITVYSYEKAEEISKAALELGKIQDIMLKVNDSGSEIYPGQESGFETENIEEYIKKILSLKGVNINGLTSFPCFLYNKDEKCIKPTENIKAVMEAKKILKDRFSKEIEQTNLPSATSVENMKMLSESGGTHGEPGHSLTGTVPMAEDLEIAELPAYIYVSEISHNFRGKGYFYGGGYYRRGNFENEEDSKAIYWYQKSAEQGNLTAQYLLAESYYSGDGVEQDYAQVAFWCSKAASQEIDENDEYERNILARSQYRLSGLYIEGKGVDFSKEKGMYWLRKSCENFYDKACETLNKLKK